MAEIPKHSTLDSTEALLKRLCFIISEKRQVIADFFYSVTREYLSSGLRTSQQGSSTQCLNQNSSASLLFGSVRLKRSSSNSDFMTEIELVSEQNKVHDFLLKLDKKLASDFIDFFYSVTREYLSSGLRTSQQGSSTQCLNQNSSASLLFGSVRLKRSSSNSDFMTEIELVSEQNKVHDFLLKLDKKLASDFIDFFNAIRYDKNVVLRERTAFLRFILRMARTSEKSDETILDQPELLCNDVVGKLNYSLFSAQNNGEKASATAIEQLFSVRKKASPVVAGSNSISSQCTSRGFLSEKSESFQSLQRSCNQQISENSVIESQSTSSNSKQLVKADNYYISKYDDNYKDSYDNIGISEKQVIRYILYTWQGIDGVIFKLNPTTQMYYVDEKYPLEKSVKQKSETLVHLGYLHNRIKKFVDDPVNDGMVRKCLIGYVRNQLSEFYNLIAHIGSQSKNETNPAFPNLNRRKMQITLGRLKLLYMHPAKTFQDLISILEFTEHFHGGYLASGIYCFMEHGDPNLQCLVKEILSQICRPLYAKMIKWLIDGELYDPHKEFFIAYNPNITGDRLWHEKYTVRISMLPEFISVPLANKILSVGKSINFLREICNDNQPFAEKDKIRESFLNTDVEVMYLSGSEDEMERLIEPAYTAINKRVMDVLIDKYSLLSHFQAHRKYLLLGQGDFIHHLMDLLGKVLESPADQLHPQHLNGILGSAIRGTTARYENENILNRLDAATLNQSVGDNGWDVFYLRYHIDGPIGTVFSLSKEIYQLLFYALTKAKRMEMVLSKLWKKQITAAKIFRKLPELIPVLRQCNKLTSEMVHFIRQTQYYFLFEILECSWNQLIQNVNQAESLDAVIAAHQQFLLTVKSGVFKDEEHEDLSNQLCIIYDLIVQLNTQVEDLMEHSQREVAERTRIDLPQNADKSPRDDSDRLDHLNKRKDFIQKFIPNANINLKILTKTYQDTLKKLLLMLNSQHDLNLQLLSVRLDFNEHYKNLDSRLVAPLTFQHRRLSSMGDKEINN